MSTAVMTLGGLQQARPLQQPSLQQNKKMVMMLDMQQPPTNGTCVIVSTNGFLSSQASGSPPHFTNLDSHMTSLADNSTTSTGTTTIVTTANSNNRTIITNNNNNNVKSKNNNNTTVNNNLNKVNRSQGGAVQKSRPIAPAASRGSVLVNNTTTSTTATSDALRCKRRIQFSGGQPASTGQHLQFAGHQPASVARRNARERNRVKQVNNGFATLRSHIPAHVAAALQESSGGSSSSSERGGRSSKQDKEAAKKLSKVETLRMAVEYIRSLQCLLNESGGGSENTPLQVKSESGSPNGFDADYETALALSHYSAQQDMHQSHLSHGGHQTHQLLPGLTSSMSPPCSDASSSSSPTPSYVSDGSVGASSTGYAPMYGRLAATSSGHLSQCRTHVDSPHTPPEAGVYEPMSPEDEELLDVISWWQQSN